jgi:hypothetical protein
MAQPVNLAEEFTPPDVAGEAPASPTKIMEEFDPPPRSEQIAIANDAHEKVTDWKKAFQNAGSPKEGIELVRKWAGEKAAEAFSSNAGSVWEEANAPLVHVPRAPQVPSLENTPASMRPMQPAASVLGGAYNTAAGFAESLTAPLNIGTLGTFGALTKVAAGVGPAARAAQYALAAIKVGFGAEMAKAAGGQAGKASVDLANPDIPLQEKVETGLAPLVTGGLAILSAAHGAKDVTEAAARSQATAEKTASAPSLVDEFTAPQPDAPLPTEKITQIEQDLQGEVAKEAPASPPAGAMIEQVSRLTPDEFANWEKEQPGGQTGASNRVGIEAIGNKELIRNLKEKKILARAELDDAMKAAKSASDADFESTSRTLMNAASKDQFFSEAISSAEGTGSALQDPAVVEAHQAFNMREGIKTADELTAKIADENKAKGQGADVEMTKQLLGDKKYKVVEVPVEEIGPEFGQLQNKVTAKYMATPSEEPVILARVDGEGPLRPVDGKHRVAAAKNTGQDTIKAYVPVDDPIAARPASEVATSEVGLGAASPAEFEPTGKFVTSLKNEVVDQQRVARGLPPAMQEARKSFGATWDEAMKRIDEDQNAADALISDLKETPRATTDVESAILLHREIDLRNTFDRATKNIDENIGTPDSLAADRETSQRALDELQDLYDVSKSAGTETGRGLNARKMLAAEDFSLSSMMTKRRVAKGGEKLTAEEQAEVQRQFEEVASAQRALDEVADGDGNLLQAKLDKAKNDFNETLERDRYDRLTGIQKVRENAIGIYDAARNLMTTGDFSFVLRQGKLAVLSHPILAAKAFPKTFEALLADEVTARAIDNQTFSHPDFPEAQKAKLHLVEEGEKMTAQDEAVLASRFSKDLPVVRKFNQAGRVFLNKLRFDVWRALRSSLDKPTEAQDKQIAQFVNEATGRGGLGPLERAAIPLGRLLFSPRYLASRIQVAVGHSMWGGDMATRRIIAKEYAKFLVGLGVYYSALNLALSGNDKKKPVVTFDPRSPDFGKVKLGNTRLDPLAGLSQVIVFGSRTATGERMNAAGKVLPIRGKVPFGGQKWTDVAATFARSKLHPIPGAIVNLFDGTDLAGKEATLLNQAANMVVPLTYVDIYQALEEQDLPEGVALSLLALLGEGLQTYKPKPAKQMGSPKK